MLLGAHSDVCTVGELKATHLGNPEDYRCSCGSLITQCDFWHDVSRAMAKRGIEGFDITHAGTSIFDVPSGYARRLLAPLYRDSALESIRDHALALSQAWRLHYHETQRRNGALVKSLQELTNAKVIVDSSKIALRLKYLLQIPGLDIKVIRLVRDGRAVALTYTDEWSFADASDPALRGGGSGTRRKPPRRNMADAAREWKRSNEAADCLVKRLPADRWTQVRYEELCARPAQTLERLCDFLEIDPAKINLNFRSCRQHIIGNGMRLDSTDEIKLDDRWRSNLSANELAIFDKTAGVLNRKYGFC